MTQTSQCHGETTYVWKAHQDVRLGKEHDMLPAKEHNGCALCVASRISASDNNPLLKACRGTSSLMVEASHYMGP